MCKWVLEHLHPPTGQWGARIGAERRSAPTRSVRAGAARHRRVPAASSESTARTLERASRSQRRRAGGKTYFGVSFSQSATKSVSLFNPSSQLFVKASPVPVVSDCQLHSNRKYSTFRCTLHEYIINLPNRDPSFETWRLIRHPRSWFPASPNE